MSAQAPQLPQRVCPRCSTVARTVDAHCPYCGTSYARGARWPAAVALAVASAALVLAGVAVMLVAFGDRLDRELSRQVETVQDDLERELRGLERRFEGELQRRLPATPAVPRGS